MKRSAAAARLLAGLASLVASAASAQQAAAPPAVEQPLPTELDARPPKLMAPVVADDKGNSRDLRAAADAAGTVFDGTLLRSTVSTPPGMRVLVTEYTFQVNEYFRGAQKSRLVTVRETGGVLPNGDGMGMSTSHKLTLTGRYLVFLRPDAADVLAPFGRVLQILDSGNTVATESGRIVIGIENGELITREIAEVRGLDYLGMPPAPGGPVEVGPPDMVPWPAAEQAAPDLFPDHGPLPASKIFDLIRAPGGAAFPGAALGGLTSGGVGGPDYNYCGYINASSNFYSLMPDNNHWAYFTNAEVDWNTLVGAGGSSTWIFGYFLDANNNPIRNENPVANNNRNNAAVPSDATMIAGGYGSWAANASPNGICFFWFTGGNCTRIRETDVFANPAIGTNELQYRKTFVHELGHAIGFGHEDRYVAIMVSGTWRVPPNYGSNLYNRADETYGGRQMLIAANGISPGSWAFQNWRDISTVPQTHPNVGTSGDVGPNVTTLSTFNASTGQVIQIQKLHVENRGSLAYSGPVTLSVYLSTNTIISSGDYLVWQGGWSSYGAYGTSYNFSENITIPASVPSGTYYIGWILTSGEAELQSGNNIGIMVRDSSSSFSPRTIQITNTVPANDSCGNALPITDGSYGGSTAAATNDGQTTCGTSNTTPDVWFSYVASCAGTLTVTTCGSTYDTVLSVHSGCPGTAANTLFCNDDDAFCGGSPARQSYINMPVTAGSTYLIRVSGYNGAVGNYMLSASLAAAIPANDLCANAIPITNGTYAGSTICATTDGDAACTTTFNSPDVWYRYTPTATGVLNLDTCSGSDFDTVLSVHTGCPGTAANAIACDDDGCGYPYSSLSAPVVAGTPYLIRVSGYNGLSGNFSLRANLVPAPPANNNCASATVISNGVTPFTTIGATTDGPTEPGCNFCCGDLQVNQDVWYKYTASCTGTATVSLCGSDYDTKVAVYAGGCPSGPGTAIACNDDALCGAQSTLQSLTTFPTTAGAIYTIRVGGYSTAFGSGSIDLSCAPAAACYANCDGSTIPPILNVNDFICFQTKYAAGDPYANCDGSSIPPILNVNDFICFQTKFAQGCP